jgi:hypothetical protein
MNRFNKKPTNVFIRPEGYEPQWRPAFVPSTSYDYTQLSNEEQRQYDPAEITGEQGLKFTPIVDDFRRLGENTFGAATSWVGFAGYRAFESVANLIDPTAGGDMIRMEPLNLTDDPTEPDSMNRLEIIAKDLYDNRVPIEDYGYILSASTYGEYEDRLTRVKLASPEAREASGFFGKAVGTVADTAALLALGVASDGMLIAGFGTRGAVAGVIENRASMDLYRRMIDTAQEAAKFTNTISRTNLIGRGVAIGLAEQAMIDTLTEQLDPTYRDASIGAYVLSGSIYGAVGGAVGRALVAEQFGKFMRKAQREVVIGGAYVGAPMDFSWNSASDLDQTVLRQAPVSERVDQVGQRAADRYMELRNKYQAAGPDADINTVLTPEELQWLRTDPVAQVLNKVEVLGESANVRFADEAVETTRQVARQRQIASDAMYEANRRGLKGDRASKVVLAAVEFILRLDQKNLLEESRRIQSLSTSLHRALASGLEEGLSGAALTQYVKKRIWARLNDAEKEALKFFLDEGDDLTKAFRLANFAKTRRPFRWFLESYGLNREWDDIIEQDRLVDEMWDLYNAGFDDDSIRYGLDENLNRSFIVEFMNNLRNSGARLNRQQFDEMLAELREVVSNPPRLKSGKVDRRARLTRLAEVHNRWVDAGAAEIGAAGPMPKRKIKIPDYAKKRLDEILKRVEDERAAAATTAAGTGGRNITRVASDPAEPLATTPDEAVAQMNATHKRLDRDIPILNRIYERLPGGIQRAFSQTKAILGNKNPYIRQFGMIVQNARTAMVDSTGKAVSQASTVLEQGISAINAYLSTTLISLRNNYIRYALEKSMDDPITLKDAMRSAFVKGDKKREFYRKVIGVLRGGTDESAAVMEAAKTMRKVMDDIHQVAKDLKIKGLEFMEENYFPRLWRFEVIRDIAARTGGRDDLINLFRKALATAGTDAAPMRQFRDADGNILEFDDIENAAIVFTDKLIAMANRADNAPLTAYDEELSKAIDRLLGPVAGEPKGVRTHRGKGRAILNEKASITASADYFKRGSSDLTLDDLTNLDLPTVMKKYLVSVQGEINAKKMVDILNKFLADNRIYKPFKDGEPQGFVEIEKIEEWLKLSNDLGAKMGVGEADASTAAAMKTMIGAIRFEPIQHANNEMKILNELGQDVAGVMLPLVYMAKGGWFAFSAISELSRVATTAGLRQMIAQMPIMADMVKNWYNMDEGAKNFSMLVDQAFHPSTDRLRRTLYQDLQGEMVTAVDGTVGGLSRSPRAIARRAAERASAAFADISLLAPITSFSQQLMATSTLQHLYDVAKGQARRMDDTTIRTLGLEPEQYDRIIQFVGNNARTDRTWGMDRVVDLRQLAGDDFDMLKGFIDRAVRTRIQDVPTRGDFHDLAFSFSGKIFTQFRTFSLKSVDNFLFQNASRIAHGDIKAKAQVAAEMSAAALTGALIMYARSRLQYESAKERGDKEQMKFIEQRLGVEGFIKSGLSSAGEFFLPGMIADVGMQYVVDPTARGFGLKDTALNRPLFDPYGFSQTSLFNTPTGSFMSSAYKVAKDIMEQDFNQKTLHNMRLLTPGSNFVGWSKFLDISEQQIADYFNIPMAKR